MYKCGEFLHKYPSYFFEDGTQSMLLLFKKMYAWLCNYALSQFESHYALNNEYIDLTNSSPLLHKLQLPRKRAAAAKGKWTNREFPASQSRGAMLACRHVRPVNIMQLSTRWR